MFLSQTDGLCNLCQDNFYYDITAGLCRDWEQNCNAGCAYRREWFLCAADQVYDADTMKWVTEWQENKYLHQASDLISIGVWKSSHCYVDPLSDENIELGTITYPYRHIKSCMAEVLYLYSYSNVDFKIFIKDGSNLYIEDGSNFVLNISSISLLTYNAGIGLETYLIPTTIAQFGVTEKAAFHLLKHTDINPVDQVNAGTYTTANRKLILDSDATFIVFASSIYIDGVNVQREIDDSNSAVTFLIPVNLQDNWVSFSKLISA